MKNKKESTKRDITRKINKENFNCFLIYMKEQKGISPASIVRELDLMGIDNSVISNLRYNSGFVKIEFLQALHEKYKVNPEYLLGESSIMFDNIAPQFKGFTAFVKAWDTVIKLKRTADGEQKRVPYLHLSMNREFYDFLLEVDQNDLYTKEGFLTESEYINRINTIFNNKNESIQDFVVIPCEDFLTIIDENKKSRKALEEVLNPSEHEVYSKPSSPKIIKKKKQIDHT